MNKAQFQAYCIDFSGYGGLPPGIKVSHTFVASPSHNWNCFGTGKEAIASAKVLPSGAGLGYEQWASYVYGPYDGKVGDCPAAGLHVQYDGVCHNAANRILVLANADVSDATGNALVILMYGKFGFNIPKYIQSVKDAAQRVNTEAATTIITQQEIDAVVARITGDPAGEFNTLEKDILRSHFEDQLKLHDLRPDQLDRLRQIYGGFQESRLKVFNATEAHAPSNTNIQAQYANAMKPVLSQCLEQMLQTLGEDQFLKMFQASPEQAISFLLG
jgi:hypothetical protein